MIGAPCDMEVGAIHDTNSSGQLEVVRYDGSSSVLVRFIDTGYERKAHASAIRNGSVADRTTFKRLGRPILDDDIVTAPPCDLAVGTVHKTKGRGDIKVIHYKNKKAITVKFIDSGEIMTCHARAIRCGFGGLAV